MEQFLTNHQLNIQFDCKYVIFFLVQITAQKEKSLKSLENSDEKTNCRF